MGASWGRGLCGGGVGAVDREQADSSLARPPGRRRHPTRPRPRAGRRPPPPLPRARPGLPTLWPWSGCWPRPMAASTESCGPAAPLPRVRTPRATACGWEHAWAGRGGRSEAAGMETALGTPHLISCSSSRPPRFAHPTPHHPPHLLLQLLKAVPLRVGAAEAQPRNAVQLLGHELVPAAAARDGAARAAAGGGRQRWRRGGAEACQTGAGAGIPQRARRARRTPWGAPRRGAPASRHTSLRSRPQRWEAFCALGGSQGGMGAGRAGVSAEAGAARQQRRGSWRPGSGSCAAPPGACRRPRSPCREENTGTTGGPWAAGAAAAAAPPPPPALMWA
jgi:hypothetical protein